MLKKIAAVTVLLSLLAVAPGQDTKPEKKAEGPEPIIVKAQLPKGWSKLALSAKQKKDIYSARAQFAAKRQKLLDQIEALKGEEAEALNKLLTEAQRQQLANLKK